MTDQPIRDPLPDDLARIAGSIPPGVPNDYAALRQVLALLPPPTGTSSVSGPPPPQDTSAADTAAQYDAVQSGGIGTINGTALVPGSTPGSVIAPGSLPPIALDTMAPKPPTALALTSDTTLSNDGSIVVRLIASLTQPTQNADNSALGDLAGCWVEVAKDVGGSPDWTYPGRLWIVAGETTAAIEGVQGMQAYWARAWAVDTTGNKSSVVTIGAAYTTIKDAVAPTQPTGLTAVGGFKGVAVDWDAAGEADLDMYQVRWGTDNATWPGLAETKATVYWVPSLVPGTTYYFQVRAVDTSGNVCATNDPAVAVDYLANPDAGWTASKTAVPSIVGSTDIAASTITAALITAGGITADLLTSGRIVLKSSGSATGIDVYNSATPPRLVGTWDPANGIKILGGVDTDYVLLNAGYLRFYSGGVEVATIGPSGIYADSIRTGTLDGGHNVIRNSSFEMSSLGTTGASATFTDSTGTPGWKAANRTTAPDNITESTALTMSVTF